MSSDTDELLQLFDSVKAEYGTLLIDFEEDNTYIKGEYGHGIIPDNWADEGLRDPIILTTITDAVDGAADHLLTVPRITIPERPVESGREKQRELAENKRFFLDMFWDRVFTENGDPVGYGKKSLIKGKMVLKLEINWHLLPEAPKTRSKKARDKYRNAVAQIGKSQFLWNLTLVPKETVFEDIASPHDPQFVFEAFQITVAQALRRFPKLKEHADLAARDPMERVDYKEYWSKPSGSDRGRNVQWIEDERVHDDFNPYSFETPRSTNRKPDWNGRLPHSIGDPGWGDVGSDNNPFDRYVSLIRYMRPIALAETRQMTAAEVALRFNVWKLLLGKNMGEYEEGEKELRIGPGAFLNLSEDQELATLEMGELPVSLFQFLGKVQAESDRHSRFGAMSGSPQRGVDTATEATQNLQQAVTKLSGPVRTLRRMVMQINKWVLQDIEKILEVPVTLYGSTNTGPSEVTLNPSDIKGFYFTNVELATSDEAALNLRNLRTWIDAAQSAPVSWKTAMSKGGIENAAQEMIERQIEDLERSEPVSGVLLSYILSVLKTSPEGIAAMQALQSVSAQQGGEQSPNIPTESTNPVEALRQTARNEAIQNQPERQTQ